MSDCCSIKPSAVAAKLATGTKTNCPRCGQPGQSVPLQTLKHQVKPEHLETVEAGVFNFCRTATCEVVYFNAGSVVLTKADVRQRIGLKETADPVPLCYCFGFTKAMWLRKFGRRANAPSHNASRWRSRRATAPVKSAIPKVRAVWATSMSQSKRQCEGRRVRYAVATGGARTGGSQPPRRCSPASGQL